MNLYIINLVSGKRESLKTDYTLGDLYMFIKKNGMLYIENEKIFMASAIVSIEKYQ